MNVLPLLLAVVLQQTPPPVEQAPESPTIDRCILVLINHADVPAPEAGALVDIAVDLGDSVAADATLAQLNQQSAEADVVVAAREFELAQAQADSKVRVLAAEAAAIVQDAEYLQGADLAGANPQHHREGELSEAGLRRLLLNPRQAQLKTAAAELDQKLTGLQAAVKQAQLEQAKIQLQRRKIVAPINGVVEQVYRRKGEWVAPGEPVFRLVDFSRLYIEGMADSAEIAPAELQGRKLMVTVDLPAGQTRRFPSTVGHVSQVIENSGRFRFRAELKNLQENQQWVLMPGLSASVSVLPR